MLIIDMPMPVKEWNCLDCKALCVDMIRHYCGITKKTIDTLKNMRARPDWCPIKGELPDEHGDLIDRDEVKQKMIHYGFHAIDMTATEFCEDELRTVIAAERKDNG
jgi:hypothetical protein